MIRKNITLALIFFIFLLLISCNRKSPNGGTKALNKEYLKLDPVCGDSVLWSIQFQGGFQNDNLILEYEDKESMSFEVENLSSGGNSCTNTYISCYNDEYDGYHIFIKNMPSFNSVYKLKNIPSKDSLKLDIIINNVRIPFKALITEDFKFFGVNYSRETEFLSYLPGKECFRCK